MQINVPIEMLHGTNCIFIIAPMRKADGEYGYVATPLAREMLESECKPIHDMLEEAVTYYERQANDA